MSLTLLFAQNFSLQPKQTSRSLYIYLFYLQKCSPAARDNKKKFTISRWGFRFFYLMAEAPQGLRNCGCVVLFGDGRTSREF